MYRVEAGELPDAAETEAQWSTVVTTVTPSTGSHTGHATVSTASSETTDSSECEQEGGRDSVSAVLTKQRTKGSHFKRCATRAHRQLAPVDQGRYGVKLLNLNLIFKYNINHTFCCRV